RETAEVVARELGELPPGTRLLIGFDRPVVEALVPPAVNLDAPEVVDEVHEQQDEADLLDGVEADPRVASAAGNSVGPGDTAASAAGAAAIGSAIEALRRKGFGRLLVDVSSGRAVAFDDIDPATLKDRSILQVVVDRVQLNGEDIRQRLTDSIETAYLEGGGAAWA